MRVVTVKLPEDLVEQLAEIAKSMGTSVSALIRNAIIEYMFSRTVPRRQDPPAQPAPQPIGHADDPPCPSLAYMPARAKQVLAAILVATRMGSAEATTSEIYSVYEAVVKSNGGRPRSMRWLAQAIDAFEMVGIVQAKVISRGRHGVAKLVRLAVDPVGLREHLEEDPVAAGFLMAALVSKTGR